MEPDIQQPQAENQPQMVATSSKSKLSSMTAIFIFVVIILVIFIATGAFYISRSTSQSQTTIPSQQVFDIVGVDTGSHYGAALIRRLNDELYWNIDFTFPNESNTVNYQAWLVEKNSVSSDLFLLGTFITQDNNTYHLQTTTSNINLDNLRIIISLEQVLDTYIESAPILTSQTP
jgi:hypothetical protein